MTRERIRRIGTTGILTLLLAVALVVLPACEKPAAPPADKPATQPAKPAPAPAPTTKPAPTPATKPAVKPAAGNLVPIPLVLPKPRFSGTPKNLPPGTRVKVTKGPTKPRPPFKAPKGVKNVALKKPVTASDMEPVIGTLDLVTDGSKEAVEDAYVELGPEVQWVQVDLEAVYKIYAVVLWHEHKDPRVYHDVVIQVADDKDFITNVRTIYTNDHDNSAGLGLGKEWEFFETNAGHLVDAKGIQARYIRCYSNGSTADDLNRYTELEVYALPGK